MSAVETAYLPDITAGGLYMYGRVFEHDGWHGNGDVFVNAPIPTDLELQEFDFRRIKTESVERVLRAVMLAPSGQPMAFGPPGEYVDVRGVPGGWRLRTTYVLYCEAVAGLGGTWEWIEVDHGASSPDGARVDKALGAAYLLDGHRRAFIAACMPDAAVSQGQENSPA